MGRRALTGGGSLAALALIALYALLGGGLGEDGGGSETTTPAATASTPVPAPGDGQTEDGGQAPSGGSVASAEANLSEEEARGIAQALAAIETGELPFERDGTTFQNREGLLPQRDRGYYREYTVITPGSDDRGARRLVIGAGGETFYTRDHYGSFVRIEPEELR